MFDSFYLIIPLIAAILYALASMAIKVSTQDGVDVSISTALANGITALLFMVCGEVSPGEILPDPWWSSLVLGVLFYLGQLFTIQAFNHGDISIATPILSSKPLLVSILLTFFFDQTLSLSIWLTALLTCIGIFFLQSRSSSVLSTQTMVKTLCLSLLAAFFFSAFDVYVQVWSQSIGFWELVPAGIFWAFLMSLGFLPSKIKKFGRFTRKSYFFLGLGTFLMSFQALLFVSSIGLFSDAPRCNIVYSSRGLWGIVLVYFLGNLFSLNELNNDTTVFKKRMFGACLITLGIVPLFL